jgi:hypothetical protein
VVEVIALRLNREAWMRRYSDAYIIVALLADETYTYRKMVSTRVNNLIAESILPLYN